jgi:hypothetical protein
MDHCVRKHTFSNTEGFGVSFHSTVLVCLHVTAQSKLRRCSSLSRDPPRDVKTSQGPGQHRGSYQVHLYCTIRTSTRSHLVHPLRKAVSGFGGVTCCFGISRRVAIVGSYSVNSKLLHKEREVVTVASMSQEWTLD